MKLNKTNHISNIWKVGGDYFGLFFLRKSNTNINYYLDQFNIDDYWIYKRTRHQKIVSIKEFMDFNYGGYIFFRKDLYDKNIINKWLEYIIDFGGIQFLDKPLPPFDPNKIIIKK